MRESSHINRQEQVKVVIRLKPDTDESRYSKCVYLPDNDDNQLVVETDQKRQIFMFDHVAHQMTSQLDIYRMIGQQCVQQCLEGYNGCIFAYGQTGAGKTYSVLGSLSELNADIYCESRGILPRLLEQFFDLINSKSGEKQTVICSYMEIYNEQIYDLLCPDKRIHQIREDAKKGVFVEGLVERKISSYKSAVGILLQGEKTRKIATTLMNTESSRSHAIFSLELKSQIIEEGVTISKKAKLHVIDLAGSERIKHTHVEGERLREGCNINKSLHVLGNVINALVESAKKKKHIPFRDSKLTHYLKDSLSGNSITKLLANVHTSKQYLGDTLSTLMFAKRAKILKMKVEVNQSAAGNYDALRKQIRKLREELAQARYFKAQVRQSEQTNIQSNDSITFERLNIQLPSEIEMSSKSQQLRILQENEMHFKALIEIYEEHMKTCKSQSQTHHKQSNSILKQRMSLQKRYTSLTHIIKQSPSFAKIYRQNLLLKQQRDRVLRTVTQVNPIAFSSFTPSKIDNACTKEDIEQIVNYYQSLISELEVKFKDWMSVIQQNYLQLQTENKLKDKKIKDLKKKRDYPPDIEELKNQNEYLHLNILNLENQITKLQQNQDQIMLEATESKKDIIRKMKDMTEISDCDQSINSSILDKLVQIKRQAERERQINDTERNQMLNIITKLHAEVAKLNTQINSIKQRKSHSKSSYHKDRPVITNTIGAAFKSSEPRDIYKQQLKYLVKPINTGNDELNLLSQGNTNQVLALKLDVKRKHKEIIDLKKDLEVFVNGDRQIQEEFGKTIQQIIQQYRSGKDRRTLQQSKSVKALLKWNQINMNQSNLTVKKSNHQPNTEAKHQKEILLSIKKNKNR